MKFFSSTLIVLVAVTCAGCVVVRDTADNIAGTYLKGLERNHARGASRVVDYGVDESFERTLNILVAMNAKIMRVESHNYSILAVVSGGPMLEDAIDSDFDANTADVGIFFSEAGPQRTTITLRCLSTSILEYASDAIFSKL